MYNDIFLTSISYSPKIGKIEKKLHTEHKKEKKNQLFIQIPSPTRNCKVAWAAVIKYAVAIISSSLLHSVTVECVV